MIQNSKQSTTNSNHTFCCTLLLSKPADRVFPSGEKYKRLKTRNQIISQSHYPFAPNPQSLIPNPSPFDAILPLRGVIGVLWEYTAKNQQ
ncbi:hypothetical protein B4U84_15270 [Westiellopsis prolifica IICB1]|nr:hypothetical protein B4U84_15270 [Westiellopsis prolifica IICB1]